MVEIRRLIEVRSYENRPKRLVDGPAINSLIIYFHPLSSQSPRTHEDQHPFDSQKSNMRKKIKKN